METIDNVLSEPYVKLVHSVCDPVNYTLGWSSAGENSTDKFFNHSFVTASKDNRRDITDALRQSSPGMFIVWRELREKLFQVPSNVILLRAYSNMTMYGVDAYPHIDVDPWFEEDRSLVYYLHTGKWNPAWGGATIEISPDGKIEGSFPLENRISKFISSHKHQGLPVSRSFTGVRKVLVFKVRFYSLAEEEFILRGWDLLPHNSGNFGSHLIRTGWLAKQEGASETLINAAKYHAVLGTPFMHLDNPFSVEELENIIGSDATEIVIKFSAMTEKDRETTKDEDLKLLVDLNKRAQFKKRDRNA